MRYLSIDTETTGLDPIGHQILEIGAIVEDTDNILPYEELPKINIILYYDHIVGTPYALGMNTRILEILQRYEKVKNNYGKVLELEKEVGSKIVPHHTAWQFLYDFVYKHYLTEDNREKYPDSINKIGPDSKPIPIIAAGKNVAGFDIPFLKRLPMFENCFKFGSRCIDPGNFMVKPTDKIMPGSDVCAKRAGIGDKVFHIALADSWDMIQILRFGAKGFLYP